METSVERLQRHENNSVETPGRLSRFRVTQTSKENLTINSVDQMDELDRHLSKLSGRVASVERKIKDGKKVRIIKISKSRKKLQEQ